jgi:hypothetical protein
MKAIVVYWSETGNTEKVALAINDALDAAGVEVLLKRVEQAGGIDWYGYDLICIGFPSYQWSPPKPVDTFLKEKFRAYRKQGHIKTGAPKVPGKHALIFCTYSGPHTGINEAIPAGKYAGQFFEHLGFTVLDEWYVVGEFHGRGSGKDRTGHTALDAATLVSSQPPLRRLRITLPVQRLSMKEVTFDLKSVHKPSQGFGSLSSYASARIFDKRDRFRLGSVH